MSKCARRPSERANAPTFFKFNGQQKRLAIAGTFIALNLEPHFYATGYNNLLLSKNVLDLWKLVNRQNEKSF